MSTKFWAKNVTTVNKDVYTMREVWQKPLKRSYLSPKLKLSNQDNKINYDIIVNWFYTSVCNYVAWMIKIK